MADDNKKNEKSSPPHSDFAHSMLANLFREAVLVPVIIEGGKWMGQKLRERGDENIAQKKERERNKNYFQDAMVKLRATDPHAADIIDDFDMNWLTDDADREDFQNNAAKTGKDDDAHMADTIQFLQQFAALPDHATREALLRARGYIGTRSEDAMEKTIRILGEFRDGALDLPADVRAGLTKRIEQLKKQLKKLDDQQIIKDTAAHAKTSRQRAVARLKSRLS